MYSVFAACRVPRHKWLHSGCLRSWSKKALLACDYLLATWFAEHIHLAAVSKSVKVTLRYQKITAQHQ